MEFTLGQRVYAHDHPSVPGGNATVVAVNTVQTPGAVMPTRFKAGHYLVKLDRCAGEHGYFGGCLKAI